MTQKLTASGNSVVEALERIAEQMKLTVNELDYEIIREQFFTEDGKPCGVEILEVKAWEKEKVDTTELEKVQNWLKKLLNLMNIEAEVSFTLKGKNNAELRVKSEHGGRIVGRKGTTLHAIRTVMKLMLEKAEIDWFFSIEVDGGERKREDRGSRDDRRDRKSRTSKRDQDKLKQLAENLANKVLKSKQEVVINRELSSFERRIVHLTIQDMNGVGTESFMDGEVKRIKIIPEEVVEE